jgi:hypothetical protein
MLQQLRPIIVAQQCFPTIENKVTQIHAGYLPQWKMQLTGKETGTGS